MSSDAASNPNANPRTTTIPPTGYFLTTWSDCIVEELIGHAVCNHSTLFSAPENLYASLEDTNMDAMDLHTIDPDV